MRDLSGTDLFSEGVPRLSETPLLLAQFRGSSHRRQQRHDGTPLLIKGHQKGLKHLRKGKRLLQCHSCTVNSFLCRAVMILNVQQDIVQILCENG